MKKFKFLLCAFLIACFVFAALGCATPVEQKYPERWEKTHIGMSLEEFKTVWPTASYGGETLKGGKMYTVSSWGLNNIKVEYFTFEDNKLVEWNG